MTTKKTKTNQKPIEIDAHFKYRCTKCASDHWISLNEAKTKNFKIVCFCSRIIKPKRISSIKIKYSDDTTAIKLEQLVESPIESIKTEKILDSETKTIDQFVLEKCTKTLVNYGFTKDEAIDLVNKAYNSNPSDDCGQLIKNALKSFGGNNG